MTIHSNKIFRNTSPLIQNASRRRKAIGEIDPEDNVTEEEGWRPLGVQC